VELHGSKIVLQNCTVQKLFCGTAGFQKCCGTAGFQKCSAELLGSKIVFCGTAGFQNCFAELQVSKIVFRGTGVPCSENDVSVIIIIITTLFATVKHN
jgi:hypothetical protein